MEFTFDHDTGHTAFSLTDPFKSALSMKSLSGFGAVGRTYSTFVALLGQLLWYFCFSVHVTNSRKMQVL